jgi:predicted Fe-Mo cluster-binding NifX family protein
MKRIAISTDGDQVSPHFGRCTSYTIIDLEDGKVLAQEVIENPGHEPGFLPQYLHKGGVNAIVAGGMGPRAQNLFQKVLFSLDDFQSDKKNREKKGDHLALNDCHIKLSL